MNNCHQLEQYLDGTLVPTETARFESHLRGCSACRLEIEIANELDARIYAGWTSVWASADLSDSIVQCSAAHSAGAHFGVQVGYRLFALVASVVALIAIAAWYLGPHQEQIERTATKGSDIESLPVAKRIADPNSLRVAFLDEGVGPHSSILVPQVQSNDDFTIVKAYPAIRLTQHRTFNYRRTQDAQAN